MTRDPHAVMIFAAGFGTRMGALTKDTPKPLIRLNGVALIDHSLAVIREIHPSAIVANTHYLAEQMNSHLRPLGVIPSHEHPDVLETGGGLKAALPLLGPDPVFTLNPDAIWCGPNPLLLLKSAWDPDKMDGLLMCIPTGAAIGHDGTGDFTLSEDGRASRGPGMVYGGAQILKTDGLNAITEKVFSLHLLWDRMLDNERLFGMSYPGQWCDVGNPAGLAEAEVLLRKSDA